MTYEIRIKRSAQKELAKIQTGDRDRIAAAIRRLAVEPRPAGAAKLRGRPGWRIRIGRYRVLYRIEDRELLVLVVRVGHRSEVYR